MCIHILSLSLSIYIYTHTHKRVYFKTIPTLMQIYIAIALATTRRSQIALCRYTCAFFLLLLCYYLYVTYVY